MRLPRVRFTVRGLMVAVAVAAAIQGGWALHLTAGRRAELARRHGEKERIYGEAARKAEADARREEAEVPEPPRAENSIDPLPPSVDRQRNRRAYAELDYANARRWREKARYHGRLTSTYGRAARYPWLSVAPDPPEPE